MIREILPELLIVATASLVALPLLALRVKSAFRPVELTRYNAVTMTSGLTFLLIALVLCAVPIVASIGGGSVISRHFFPGGAAIGWVSALGASVLLITLLVGVRRAWRVESRLLVEPDIGEHYHHGTHELVVLDLAEPLAYAIGGRTPQVVITTGLADLLSDSEIVSVVEHEVAHIDLDHRPHLILVGMLKPLASVFGPVRRLMEAALLALETAADSKTSDSRSTRSALLKLSGVPATPGIAAFTAGDVVARLDALAATDRPVDKTARILMWGTAAGLVAISLGNLVVFWI